MINENENSVNKLAKGTIYTLVILFVFALAIRLYNLDKPMMEFFPTRQYHSALIAMKMYDADSAVYLKPATIEPPIMETMAVIGYKIAGKAILWFPRLLSVLFWLTGGIYLFRYVRLILNDSAALFSLFYFLFLPYAILASRSFQPEPLMQCMVLAGVYYMAKYTYDDTNATLAKATIACALAILVKPNSVLVLGMTFLFIAVPTYGIKNLLCNKKLILFCICCLIPGGMYYLYNLFISKTIGYQVGLQFVPSLYKSSAYWTGWPNRLFKVTGVLPVVLYLIGLISMPKSKAKWLCLGNLTGYILMGLIFNFAIHTHSYYQIIFLPWISVPLGYLFSNIATKALSIKNKKVLVAGSAFLFVVFSTIYAKPVMDMAHGKKNQFLINTGKYLCGNPKFGSLFSTHNSLLNDASEIGELIDHSTKNMLVCADYGYPLKYHGKFDGVPLFNDNVFYMLQLKSDINPKEKYLSHLETYNPDHIIITNSANYSNIDFFLDIISKYYYILKQAPGYTIYKRNDVEFENEPVSS